MFSRTKLVAIFIFLSLGALSQNSHLDFERQTNPYLRFDNWVYDSLEVQGRNIVNFTLDTFNVCRVQLSKIKTVSVSYFDDQGPIKPTKRREYHINGISNHFNINKDSLLEIDPDTLVINCSDFDMKFTSNKRGTEIERDRSNHEKIIRKYDSLGFLIEHTEITTGLIVRFLKISAFSGYSVLHQYYEYSDDYKNVKCTWCYKKRPISKKCTDKIMWNLEFDDKRNLISEKMFRENKKGEFVFEEGFSYKYEYYE